MGSGWRREKPSLVGLDKLCERRNEDGLGLRWLDAFHIAFMAKHLVCFTLTDYVLSLFD